MSCKFCKGKGGLPVKGYQMVIYVPQGECVSHDAKEVTSRSRDGISLELMSEPESWAIRGGFDEPTLEIGIDFDFRYCPFCGEKMNRTNGR